MKKVRTVFMGTPQIACTVLENMIEAGIDIVLVVTQPDRKVGRKQKVTYSPVKECALNHDIPVFQPYRIKEEYQAVLDAKPELIVTCAFGQIVPDVILEAPVYGCVNLHGSILPKYRGAAPIQRAIWDGEKKTGMSLMKMVSAMDAGPVFDTEEIVIEPMETSSGLFEKMALAASRLLIRDYDAICSKDAHYVEQDESMVTFAAKIEKEDEKIDLSKDDEAILCQINALSHAPGGYIEVNHKKFKVYKVDYKQQEVKEPFVWLGKVDQGFGLSLHHGILIIQQCQMEGKPVVSGLDFANGQGQNLKGKRVS
ncbi:methionyl-tRNA formyltransferase [Faecalicoccus pleomorphus]|uniref:Methionyl-tRNA formyltransferase n=1 Tax=Faecalicoccus pleomorphus TaxID=1323 RepID=A0A380LIP7_9FIRM|nr:methionyl-tRNA formyltransferase [Faecalicoccus pleomorphus]SUO03728.1 methionyl-tRNA formyltransferase [Faecalicoccus pleomorphus]